MPLTNNRKLELFLETLKSNYRSKYEELKPCSYLPNKRLSVDKYFVDRDIQVMTSDEEDSWTSLSSYTDIIGGNWNQSKLRVIEALPGYGKTSLCHKLVFDWCNKATESPVSKADILLFFKSRHLCGVNSIHEAVRRFLLPNLSSLTDKDIKHILAGARSVVIFFDNVDGSPSMLSERMQHILDITRVNELQHVEKVITTRTSHLCLKHSKEITRLKLLAFNDKMQEAYLRNVVVGNDDTIAHKIKQCLQNEVVLVDICKVPLFFATFAHLSFEALTNNRIFVSVYDFFDKLMSSFLSQLTDEEDDESKTSLSISDNRKLSIFAFIGLYDGYPDNGWDTDDVEKQLGQNTLDKYLRLGILCHTNVEGTEENPKKRITFYYKVFSEWYAAFYLAGKFTHEPDMPDDPVEDTGEEILDNLFPPQCPYLFRFACAHSPVVAQQIIQQLQIIDDYGTYVVICGLEQMGHNDNVKDSLKEVCSNVVHIGFQDTDLTQSSTIQLLVVASSFGIDISGLWLNNCFEFVDRSKDELALTRELRIPILSSLEYLWIENRQKVFTIEEIKDIIDFSSKCSKLRRLKFDYSVLPREIDISYLAVFQKRNVEVHWCAMNGWFHLDLTLGRWRRREHAILLSDEEYDKEVKNFKEFFAW